MVPVSNRIPFPPAPNAPILRSEGQDTAKRRQNAATFGSKIRCSEQSGRIPENLRPLRQQTAVEISPLLVESKPIAWLRDPNAALNCPRGSIPMRLSQPHAESCHLRCDRRSRCRDIALVGGRRFRTPFGSRIPDEPPALRPVVEAHLAEAVPGSRRRKWFLRRHEGVTPHFAPRIQHHAPEATCDLATPICSP